MKIVNFIILYLLIVTSFLGCAMIPESAQINSVKNSKPIGKPLVVFIHGMFMTSDSWKNWMLYFQNEKYNVVAPAWPLHDASVAELRDPARLSKLAKLSLDEVLEYYREYIKKLPQKPILIGHSMGGLLAQKLASEGLASAVIAIDSAPPNGMLTLRWSFFRSNWGIISPFESLDEPITLDLEQFSYSFTNAENELDQKKAYETYYVPESRRLGRGATEAPGEIDPLNLKVPLLLIAGGNDHTIPAFLTYRNYNFYKDISTTVAFKLFDERDHFTILAPGWESVALYSINWLKELN